MGLDAPEANQMARLTENLNLQRGLLRHLDCINDIRLLDKVKVGSIHREEREGGGWPLVHLSDGRIIRARLLVSICGTSPYDLSIEAYPVAHRWALMASTLLYVRTLVFHLLGGPMVVKLLLQLFLTLRELPSKHQTL